MKFVQDANERVKNFLHDKSTLAFYKSLENSTKNNYQTLFATNMQSYITRIGLIVDEVVEDEKMYTPHTYLGTIDYLCVKVLNNKNLYRILHAIEINDEANNGKHSIDNINIDINECVRQYNRLIEVLLMSD